MECPVIFAEIWRWHKELSRTRQYSLVMGAKEPILHPVTYQEIEAWARLMHRNPTAYEVELLLMLDNIAISR